MILAILLTVDSCNLVGNVDNDQDDGSIVEDISFILVKFRIFELKLESALGMLF